MNKKLFIVLSISIIFLNYFSKELLNTDSLLITSISEELTKNQIDSFLQEKSKWQYIGFISTPLLLIIKILIIASILDIGCFFFGKEIKYKNLFKIVTKAEFIFTIVIVFKTIWFYFFQTNYTLEDLQFFYPLSALNIVGYQSLEPWFIYPFQVLNLFEVAYWFVLAYLIGKDINESTEKGFLIVASSYGVGLLIWVVGVMFLTLNMS